MAVPENIERLAHEVRTAIHGRDVREAFASSMEATADVADSSRVISNEAIEIANKVNQLAFGKYLEPVDTFADIETTYPNADENDRVFVRENGKTYVKNNNFWQLFAEINETPINEVDSRLTSQLEQTEKEQFKSSTVNHKSKRKMVVWQDDDGMAGLYTKIAPLLREYNIVCSAAIITGRGHNFPIDGLPSHDPTYISYEQMEELYKDGLMEFISHTHTHRYFDSLTDGEIQEELKRSRDIIKELGWNHKDFVYPGGRHDENIRKITSQYYESATKVGGTPFIGAFDQYAMPRVSLSTSGFNPSDVNALIDENLEKHDFAILMTHVDLGTGLNTNDMREVIEHVIQTGAEFVTTRELIQEHGNLLQAGSNIINSKNEVYGDSLGVYNRKYIPHNSPIDAYEGGTTTKTKVLQSDAHLYDFPVGHSSIPYGTLLTYKDLGTQDDYSFQTFHDLPNERILTRRWVRSNSTWGEWVDNDGYVDYANNPPNNAPVTYFPKGKVIKVRVHSSSVGAYNLPDLGRSSYGFILVYRDHDQDIFSTQIFYDVNNSNSLIRRWSTTTNAWTSWLPVSGSYHDILNPPSNNMPISEFQKGVVTKFKLLQDDASSYNIPAGDNPSWGAIEVHRDFTNDTYSFQIFYDIRNKRTLMRRWVSGAWDNWE